MRSFIDFLLEILYKITYSLFLTDCFPVHLRHISEEEGSIPDLGELLFKTLDLLLFNHHVLLIVSVVLKSLNLLLDLNDMLLKPS
jgi:hypothetical protein